MTTERYLAILSLYVYKAEELIGIRLHKSSLKFETRWHQKRTAATQSSAVRNSETYPPKNIVLAV